MKIFDVSIKPLLAETLGRAGFMLVGESVEKPEELPEYLEYASSQAILVDFTRSNLKVDDVLSIRKVGIGVPIVGLAAPDSVFDFSIARTNFLNSGGDDLLAASIPGEELAAVLHARIRRLRGVTKTIFTYQYGKAQVMINLARLKVTVNDIPLSITPMEFRVLEALILADGDVVKQEDIHSNIYQTEATITDSNTLQVFVSRLRKELRSVHADAEKLVETVRGAGYRIGDSD